MGLDFFLYQPYPSKMFYIKTQDQVVSGLHLLTRNLALAGKCLKTDSIVSAATQGQHRRQNLMLRVMKDTLFNAYKNHYPLITLSPVDKLLYEPYEFVPYAFSGYG